MKYSRHKNLFGKENFHKIQKATVLVAGAGGLGCCVLQLLARVGFGTIHVFDPGIVDMPDLNRQILYDENDLGRFKADAASSKLKHINSEINIVGYKTRFECSVSLPDTDIAIDCLDNFQSRLELEKLFFDKGIPIVHAGATQFFGQVTTLIPDKTNKLSDIFGKDFLLLRLQDSR